MNLNHTVKVVGSVLLSAVMAGSMMPVTVFAQSNDENPTEKTETVYSVLNSDGSISDTIVSSWLHDEDGINNIKETLNLTDVKNIKSNEKPSKDGNTYTWNAKGNDVYYEGTATKQLPVSVKLRYELDGQEMSAKDMEGKSGHLKLTISFTNNYSQVKNINGKSIVIHPSYLAGGMLNMSTGKFSNVKCESGKIVNDGTNEMLAFANIPGLNETLRSAGLDKVNNQLGISDDVTVEADVNDFDLGSIMVGMTNEIDLASELGEIGSVSELTDGIDQLIEADDQLIDGSKQLYDGTTQLKEQAAPLTGSSDQVRQLSSGAIQLNDGVKALQTGITQYTAGASAINEGVNQLYGIPQNVGLIQSAVTTSTEEQASLVDGSQAVADGLGQLLDKLNGANVTASVKEMNGLLTKSKTDLEGMAKTLGEDKTTLEGMQTDLTNASTKLSKLTPLKDKLDTLGTEIVTKETQNNTAIADYNSKKKTVNDKITAIKNSMNTEIETSITTLSTAKQALNDAGKTDEANSIQTQIDALNKEKTNVDAISTIEGLSELQTLTEEFNTLNETLGTVKSTISDMSTLVGKSISDLEGLATDVQAALTTIDTLSQILSGSTEKVEGMQTMLNSLKPGVTELYNGALKINAGAINLGNKLGELQTASQSGVDKIKAGTTQLTSNNATLNGGASALSEATGTLAGQSGTFNEMADGLDTLGKAFETLNSGAKQLYEGNEQFKSEGLDQLKEKVDLGVGELETLQSVMDEIKAMNKEYASYSGAPEGATVTSRYVFRTKEESSK
ncbi:hypothetical protein [Holdemanella biformis]|jgi:putative membrane protein|uniref:hypothetical protein n=1 Tax=Holdemanella biformis TaxID=1735 RepID=UPI002E777477|nr:hypothetical protein [Holdemanella biformis]MEE0394395.1 hypothetical protein [Holdemanella biformis]